MVGKIIAMEKKVNEMEDNKEIKQMENEMNILGSKIDKLELNVKKIAKKKISDPQSFGR